MRCKGSAVYPRSDWTLSMKTEENHLALGYWDSFQAVISCIMVEKYGMTESLTLEIAIGMPLIYKLSVQLYLKFN